jgi:hypothetical protein
MTVNAGYSLMKASMGVSIGVMDADKSMLDDILNATGPATAISMLRPVREMRTPCWVGVKREVGAGGGKAKLHATRANSRLAQ